jgi:hypothetical protein
VLVYPLALQSGFSLPAGEGALIYPKGSNDSLQWASVGQQRYHCNYQPLGFVLPVEGGIPSFGEGSPAALALVAAFFLRVDHNVILAKTAVGTTARIVTPLLARVHADTSFVWRSETKQGWRRTRK